MMSCRHVATAAVSEQLSYTLLITDWTRDFPVQPCNGRRISLFVSCMRHRNAHTQVHLHHKWLLAVSTTCFTPFKSH